MQRLSKRRTNQLSSSGNPNDSDNDHNSVTTGIKFGPTTKNMDHLHATASASDDPRQPLLGATVGAGVGSIGATARANHDDAKDNSAKDNNNSPSYGALSTSEHSITQDDEEETEVAVLEAEENDTAMDNISRKTQWILLAVASGACAAFNGVFAKLTTTQLTTSFAESVASFFGLGEGEKVVEYGVRGIFFLLNLLFNGIMWTLFTKALARGTSTVQVSIINTSSNFMITAVLGFIIFSESLPPLWFVGAALLVAGNVIIGRREEEEKDKGDLEGGERRRGEEEGDGLLAEEVELGGSVIAEGEAADGKRSREQEDVLDLALDDDDEEGKSGSDEDILLL
ncbi:hypothetical protein ACMFMG_010005 [Clarireedia jacksonii]